MQESMHRLHELHSPQKTGFTSGSVAMVVWSSRGVYEHPGSNHLSILRLQIGTFGQTSIASVGTYTAYIFDPGGCHGIRHSSLSDRLGIQAFTSHLSMLFTATFGALWTGMEPAPALILLFAYCLQKVEAAHHSPYPAFFHLNFHRAWCRNGVLFPTTPWLLRLVQLWVATAVTLQVGIQSLHQRSHLLSGLFFLASIVFLCRGLVRRLAQPSFLGFKCLCCAWFAWDW